MELPEIQITKMDIIVNTDIERQEVAFTKRMYSKTDDSVATVTTRTFVHNMHSDSRNTCFIAMHAVQDRAGYRF